MNYKCDKCPANYRTPEELEIHYEAAHGLAKAATAIVRSQKTESSCAMQGGASSHKPS